MFSNSVYHSVVSGSDDYRTVQGEGGFFETIRSAFLDTIVPEGFFNNFVLIIFLVGTCVVLWSGLKNKCSKLSKVTGSICIAVMVAFAASTLMLRIASLTALERLYSAKGAATVAFILAFIVFLFILPVDGNRKAKLFFILLSTGCMIAPLLVVTPIGSRCFFAPYVMMLYLAMEFYSMFDSRVKKKCDQYSKVTIITAAVGLIFLFYIYGTISICDKERVEKAQTDAQNGVQTVQVEELPYKKYVWCSDVKKEIWQKRFKLFYGIDEAVEIEQVSSSQKW